MIGWNELSDDIEMLSDVKTGARLEAFVVRASVPSESKLRDLAWLCVGEGMVVNMHSRQAVTILDDKNVGRKIEVVVRTDG